MQKSNQMNNIRLDGSVSNFEKIVMKWLQGSPYCSLIKFFVTILFHGVFVENLFHLLLLECCYNSKLTAQNII